MSDRKCPTCKGEFKYPSFLKKHLETTIHCKKTHTEINTIMTAIKNNNHSNNNHSNNNHSNHSNDNNDTNHNNSNNEINKCNFCKKNYKRKDNYVKHINNSNCSEHYTKQNNLQLQIQETLVNLTAENLEKFLKQGDKLLKDQNKQININNNINTINNVTINNNLIINNILHISPFGFEKLPSISKEEMKKLLIAGEKGVIEIIKLVYEQDENKNFYKINMNTNNISYLNDKYKLGICQENEMKDTLYKNCISLPNEMMVICKDILSTQEILFINYNNKNITDKIKVEIYDNGLKNIINTQLIYNSKFTKQNIDKYLTILNSNPIVKEEAINNLNTIKTIAQNTYNEFIPSLSLTKINEKLGNPIIEPELSRQITHNDFCMKKFEDTKYKKYWDKRKKDENKLIMSLKEKKFGDIIELDNRITKINKTLSKMESIHKDITFDDYLENVEIASDYIKYSDNNRIDSVNSSNDIANMSDLQVFE